MPIKRKRFPSVAMQMYTQFTLRLNDASDSDIIARINSMQNKQGYLKRLVREDILRTNAQKQNETKRSGSCEDCFLMKMFGGNNDD